MAEFPPLFQAIIPGDGANIPQDGAKATRGDLGQALLNRRSRSSDHVVGRRPTGRATSTANGRNANLLDHRFSRIHLRRREAATEKVATPIICMRCMAA